MELRQAALTLGIDFKGMPTVQIQGIRDIGLVGATDYPERGFVYFVETAAVLRRHPNARKGGIILTTTSLADNFAVALIARDQSARIAFLKLLSIFDEQPGFEPGVAAGAEVAKSARIGAGATVLPGAVIMADAVIGAHCVVYPCAVIEPHAQIGEGTVIYPCAVIGRRCVVGERGVIHSGTVIGADGFGFYDDESGRHKIPQIGHVILGNDVEVGASCTIDRATIETTVVGDRTKIDDQVHIGHNCQIGRDVYIAGNSTLGGSVVVGDRSRISGGVVVRDHVRLAPGTAIMGMTGVTHDTSENTSYCGIPARPAREMHRINAALQYLPKLLSVMRERKG